MTDSKQKNKKLLLVLLPSLAGSLAVLAAVAWLLGWFSSPLISLQVGQPGSAAQSAGNLADFRQQDDDITAMQSRVQQLLWQNPGGLADWYQLASRTGSTPASRAASYLAENQLRYGLFLLEQGREKPFETWWLSFRQIYLTPSGAILTQSGDGSAGASETSQPQSTWRNDSAALRLLAQSCSIWPDASREADLRLVSKQMLETAGESLVDLDAAVPTLPPTLDPAATPTPKPSVTPQPVSPTTILPVLRLASLDLYAMQNIAPLDDRWRALYNQYLPLVEGGYISDDLPLYALAWDDAQQGYLPFSGDVPAVDTLESLLTILHLAEVGKDNPRSLSWIREQVFNQSMIYDAYHITQGQPASTTECIAAYAVVARIARIKGDQELYQAAVDLLLWHQATSAKSEAQAALFRQQENGLIQVWATDNTWALLAIS